MTLPPNPPLAADPGPMAEHGLDPEDWDAFRRLAHHVLDQSIDSLRDIRAQPVWRPVPPEVRGRLDVPLPVDGEPAEAVFAAVLRDVLPYPLGNTHPRFWGWVIGTGTASGVLADLVASTMNPNSFAGDQASSFVEAQVLRWTRTMLGYPEDASGLLVEGASTGNLVGLAVAREVHGGGAVASAGLWGRAPMTVYASTEVHISVQKAVELLGLGADALRRVPTRPDFTIDPAALHAMIAADRARGMQPFCVVGNAGTVATGAIDPLPVLADLCAAQGLWFHVDGAIAAPMRLSPGLAPLLAGLERADSLTFDFHKWMYVQFGAGCVLVRDAAAQRRTFARGSPYLAGQTPLLEHAPTPFSDLGISLSRPFRALKIWVALKQFGTRRYAQMLAQNVAQARYLAARVQASAGLELLAPVATNIVCYRYTRAGHGDAALNDLNQRLLGALQTRGIAAPTQTTIHGRFAIRCAITNHRSRRDDFDALVEASVALGDELLA